MPSFIKRLVARPEFGPFVLLVAMVFVFRVRAAFGYTKKRTRREWLRASLFTDSDGVLAARRFPREGAGILTSMVESDGLIELSEELTQLDPGTMVDFLPFSEVS